MFYGTAASLCLNNCLNNIYVQYVRICACISILIEKKRNRYKLKLKLYLQAIHFHRLPHYLLSIKKYLERMNVRGDNHSRNRQGHWERFQKLTRVRPHLVSYHSNLSR